MSIATRFQLNAILQALAAANVTAYWPASATIGTNINADSSYSGMPTLSDRALTNYGIFYSGSPSTTTGLPTAAFSIKVTDAVATGDTWLNGTWVVVYTAPQQVNVTADYDGLNGGAAIGTVTASYNSTTHVGVTQIAGITSQPGYQLRFNFDGPVTKSPNIYAPEEGAIYLAGLTVPVLTGVMRRAIAPMARLRFMDLCLANQDFIPQTSSNFNGLTWKSPVTWSDMPQTAEDYRLINSADQYTRPIPLPMLVRAANEAGKDAWFNLPILGDDNCLYQYGLYVAQNLAPGKKATFELGNEVNFNFGGGFNNYFKAMYAGLTEVRAALPATGQRNYSLQVLTFSSDGTTATLVFNQAHGATEGALIGALNLNAGYTGFAPTGTKALHIVNSTSISYPCTQAATGGTVAGTTVLKTDGVIMLNAGADLAQGNFMGNLYDIRTYWFWKAQARMAAQLRKAFTDAGRSQAECRPMLANQGGAAYRYFLRTEANYINYLGANLPSVVPAGSTVGSLFAAACVANYLNFDATLVHPGFGYTGSNSSATTVDLAISQLSGKAAVMYGISSYQVFVCWCLENGIDPEVYEIGTDLTALADTSATGVASMALADPRIGTQVILPTLRSMHEMGFKCINWFTMNTSGPGNGYGGNKTFNSGLVTSEVDPATPTSQQSPKYAAVLAAIAAPSTRRTRQAIPCTLDGNDFVGNEAAGAYQFTGYISGTTLTIVSWIQYGGAKLGTGCILPLALTTPGTTVTSNAAANADGTGTYTVNNSQTVGSAGSPVTFKLYPCLTDVNTKYSASSYGYTGPNAQSKAYRFWSEVAGTKTLTVTVDVASGAASTLTATVLGGSAATPVVTPAGPQAGYVLPTMQVTVAAGANYIALSSPAGAVIMVQSAQLA